jgi:2-polyprenyl-3-methyl-5-hydroxy-6-metoxy-1,4-benzoquinol methylase
MTGNARGANAAPADGVYDGLVNQPLLALLGEVRAGTRVLDVGCGTGANARWLGERGAEVWGITASEKEAALARSVCRGVTVCDLDEALPASLTGPFDVLLLSHVLEHLADPAATLRALATRLTPGGRAAIAVPNMAVYDVRWRLARGQWPRERVGAFDETHRQFWTHETASTMLSATPFRLLRREPDAQPMIALARVAPRLAAQVRRLGARWVPNLVSWQTLLLAELPVDDRG